VRELEEVNLRKDERIAELEKRLRMNSRNSSKPPSLDGYNRPKPKSLRESSGRPPGGQEGHAGHCLKMVKEPERVEEHRVERCEHCGESLEGVDAREVELRQVFDLPEFKVEVTEHLAEVKECPSCRKKSKGNFPAEARRPTQYGHRVKGLASYLTQYQLIPLARTREMFRDVFGCELS